MLLKSYSATVGVIENKPSITAVQFPPLARPRFAFIDLFAGIGGFRLALQSAGGACVFSSESDAHARAAYVANFGEMPHGDTTKVPIGAVPPHDVLCAGFPCQPFSISGKMKGFGDSRGTLVHEVFRVLEARSPGAVFLENVKNLVYHDRGRTLAIIARHLRSLGYIVSMQVLNASDFGLPQNRERVVIVCHKAKRFDFSMFGSEEKPPLKGFLDKGCGFEYLDSGAYTILGGQKKQASGLVFAGYLNKTQRVAGARAARHSRAHRQTNRVYSVDGVHPTLSAQDRSGRYWIWDGRQVRKLTLPECYRIMGFPDGYIKVAPKGVQYHQIGNSVAVPMVYSVAMEIQKQFF